MSETNTEIPGEVFTSDNENDFLIKATGSDLSAYEIGENGEFFVIAATEHQAIKLLPVRKLGRDEMLERVIKLLKQQRESEKHEQQDGEVETCEGEDTDAQQCADCGGELPQGTSPVEGPRDQDRDA